jgi:hypothetical protein
MNAHSDFDFNGPEPLAAQFELIPANTLAKVHLIIRPDAAGPDGWHTQSQASDALYLSTEAVILEGPYAKRHVFTRIGIKGKSVNERGEDTYANRGRSLIRGILESARGVHPDDSSDRARAARTIRSLGDLNDLTFVAKIGIDRDRRDPNAEPRNVIAAAITPAHKDYAALMGTGAVPLRRAGEVQDNAVGLDDPGKALGATLRRPRPTGWMKVPLCSIGRRMTTQPTGWLSKASVSTMQLVSTWTWPRSNRATRSALSFPGISPVMVSAVAPASRNAGATASARSRWMPVSTTRTPNRAWFHTRFCPECEAQLPLGTSPCPFCGYVWQREISEKRLLDQFDLTEIDLLNRSPFRWCDLFGDDQSLIASGFDAWGGVFFDGTYWHAVGKPRQGRLSHLAIGTRPQVLSAADDFLRGIESTDAANKSRRWLKDPASDKQRQLLTRAGYPTASLDFGLSKYAANCHLNFLWHRDAIRSAVFAAGPRRAA